MKLLLKHICLMALGAVFSFLLVRAQYPNTDPYPSNQQPAPAAPSGGGYPAAGAGAPPSFYGYNPMMMNPMMNPYMNPAMMYGMMPFMGMGMGGMGMFRGYDDRKRRRRSIP